MQGELALALGDERDHPRVVRARTDFAEIDLVPLDEELDAENAAAAEPVGDRLGDRLRFDFRDVAHCHRLPAEDIIAVALDMADGFAEDRLETVARGQHRDLVIEIDERLDDQFARVAARLLGHLPGAVQIRFALHNALAVARRAHDRLDDAGVAQLPCGFGQPFARLDELVRARLQP